MLWQEYYYLWFSYFIMKWRHVMCSSFQDIFHLDFFKIYMASWRLMIFWGLWQWLSCIDIILGHWPSFKMVLLEQCYGSWLCSSSDIIGCYNTDRFRITLYFHCCTKNNFSFSPVSSGCHPGLVFKGPHINPSHCH